jgi:RNA polymerase sigma factor (sigma-70 family)
VLSREEEIELGKLIEAGREAQRRLERRDYKEEEREALERAIEAGFEARRRLAEANLPLVFSELGKVIRGAWVDFEELRQEGFFALMRAVDRWDWRRSKFSTFAVTAIKRSLWQAAAPRRHFEPHLDGGEDNLSAPCELPGPGEREELREAIEEVLATLPHREALAVRLRYGLDGGSPLSYREIGKVMGCSAERVRQLLRRAEARLRHPSRARRLREVYK